MELWDIYDENRNKTGKTMKRGDKLPDGAYHLVIHVCIFNENGDMLIQQRQTFKAGFPNLWDVTAGGSAVAGEDSRQAAEREVLEEIGYNISLKNHRPHFSVNFTEGFDDFFLITCNDIRIEELNLQYEEVQAVRWASRNEIHDLINQEKFVPYCESMINLLFDMKEMNEYGTIRN